MTRLLIAALLCLAGGAWAQTDTPTETPTSTPTETPTSTPTETPTACAGSTRFFVDTCAAIASPPFAAFPSSDCWSCTSGGPGGAGVPDSTLDARWDANSFTADGETVGGVLNCRNHDWSGVTHTPTYDQGSVTTISGSLTWVPGMSVTDPSTINLAGPAGAFTLDFAGFTVAGIQADSATNGATTYTLLSSIDSPGNSIDWEDGVLNTGGFSITASDFTNANDVGPPVNHVGLILGNSVITLSDVGVGWDMNQGSATNDPIDLTAGTSIIVTGYFDGGMGAPQYATVHLVADSDTVNAEGDDAKIAHLIVDAGATVSFYRNSTTTITDADFTGSGGSHIVLQSDSSGTPWVLTSSTTVAGHFVDVTDGTCTNSNCFTGTGGSADVWSLAHGWNVSDPPTPTPTETPTPTCGAPVSVINSLDDHDDGCCDAADCTVREAVTYNSGTYTFQPALCGTVMLSIGPIQVGLVSTINLQGPGVSCVAIDATNIGDNIFNVQDWNGTGNPLTFSLSGLTLQNATNTSNGDGGCIHTRDNQSSGGITLTVDHVTFTNCVGDTGGGIGLSNDLTTATISNCTFLNNTGSTTGGSALYSNATGSVFLSSSTATGGNSPGNGGALTFDGGTAVISNVTVTGNIGVVGGGNGTGSAIVSNNPGGTTVVNSTIANNSNGIAQVESSSGPGLLLTNTIVSGATANCFVDPVDAGPIASGGHNIESGMDCGFTATGDQQSTDPLLNALGSNGGPTQTMSLQLASPARNGGDDGVCAAAPVNGVDQRGSTRPGTSQTHCSIGAFEAQDAAPTNTPTETETPSGPTPTSTPTATVTPTSTNTPTVTVTPLPTHPYSDEYFGPTPLRTPSPFPTASASPSPTGSPTVTRTRVLSPTPTPTLGPENDCCECPDPGGCVPPVGGVCPEVCTPCRGCSCE